MAFFTVPGRKAAAKKAAPRSNVETVASARRNAASSGPIKEQDPAYQFHLGRQVNQPFIDAARQVGITTGQSMALNAPARLAAPVARAAAPTPRTVPNVGSGGGSSRGYSRGGGGGGRGGGGGGGPAGPTPAQQAQAQIDGLMAYINSGVFKAPAQNVDPLIAQITGATAADVAGANTAYDAYDTWLGANNQNYYAQAPQAQFQNVDPGVTEWLQSQSANPNSTAAEAALVNARGGQAASAFNNTMAQLAAMLSATQTSRGAESHLGRNQATTTLNALDNGLTAGVRQRAATQQQTAQQGLDAQKMQVIAQIIALAGQNGLAVPTPAQYGA